MACIAFGIYTFSGAQHHAAHERPVSHFGTPHSDCRLCIALVSTNGVKLSPELTLRYSMCAMLHFHVHYPLQSCSHICGQVLDRNRNRNRNRNRAAEDTTHISTSEEKYADRIDRRLRSYLWIDIVLRRLILTSTSAARSSHGVSKPLSLPLSLSQPFLMFFCSAFLYPSCFLYGFLGFFLFLGFFSRVFYGCFWVV